MTVSLSPRCSHCKTVLSPHWTRCQICHRPIPKIPAADCESRIKIGQDVVYWDDSKESLQQGRVRTVTIEHNRLVLTIESGQRILERYLRAVTERTSEGQATRAYTTRDEELRVMPSIPNDPIPTPERSSAYFHWKEIAAATTGIFPHEPRFTHIATMLNRCNDAFTSGNEAAFLKSKQQLLNFIAASKPRIKPGTEGPPAQSAKSA